MDNTVAEHLRLRNYAMQLARECQAQGYTRAAGEYLREARRIQQTIEQQLVPQQNYSGGVTIW